MALKGGSIIHTGHDTVLLERLQTAGPGTVNIPTEKIYELGNYESVATIRDVPDLTFTAESLDVSTDMEALLTDTDPGSAMFDLATAKPLNIATQIKPGKKENNPYHIAKAVALPYLTLESASYRFGLRDNATQTYTLRGDSIFYCPGPVFVQEAQGTNVPGQQIVTDHPAYNYTDANGTRRILAVVVGTQRLTFGPDYTLSDGAENPDGAAIVTVTLSEAVPTTDKIRVVYASSDTREYPQAAHTPALVKPAAVRGKDIDVYIGGYDPSNPLASAANKWTGVQAATIEWRVTQEVEEEFGNYFAVSRDFDVPTVTGTIDILPRHADDLFKKIREITGVSETNRVIGATTAVPLPLDIVIKDGENGGITLKRFHVKDARFSVPGYSPRPEQNVTMTLSFESDGGSLEIYRDLSEPIVKFLDPAVGEATDEVKIFGVNFVDVTGVDFGGTPATSYTVDSGRQITAEVPAGSGTVDVTVTTSKGTDTLVGGFTYDAGGS